MGSSKECNWVKIIQSISIPLFKQFNLKAKKHSKVAERRIYVRYIYKMKPLTAERKPFILPNKNAEKKVFGRKWTLSASGKR